MVAPITQSYSDEKGEYKICKGCQKKIYYDDWVFEKTGVKQKHAMPYFWRFKSYCSKDCMYQHRKSQFKICVHCSTKFYRNKTYSQSEWDRRILCSKSCSLEYGHVYRLAKFLKIPYEVLRDELIIIMEKYQK